MIKPEEIREACAKALDSRVEQVVDELLVKHWNGREATFKQDDVIKELVLRHHPTLTRGIIFAEKLLDFEEAYRAAGWSVEYDKPAYNETYPATFTFKKR